MEFHSKSTSLYVECRTEFLDNPSLDFGCVFNCMTHSVLDGDEDLFNIKQGRGQVEKVDLLRYFWKIDVEKIYFFYFFDLYFCFLKAFFGLKYTS